MLGNSSVVAQMAASEERLNSLKILILVKRRYTDTRNRQKICKNAPKLPFGMYRSPAMQERYILIYKWVSCCRMGNGFEKEYRSMNFHILDIVMFFKKTLQRLRDFRSSQQ
jgi:hypothetical protein